ncbi:MAG TPA: PHP domain-containing protein [Pseudonocardiaceae bacterium]
MRIDLHAHSSVSDGTERPAAVVDAAVAAGLDVVALTDHDTTAGWDEALAAAEGRPIRVIPGAELSTAATDASGRPRSVHLLAYLFDPDTPALVAEQTRLREERRRRLRRMVRLMADDGLPVDEESVFGGLDADAPAGRPHLARALVRAGVVRSVDEAFASYLRDGGPYHLRRADTPLVDAVRMITAAGGVTVLAHPLAGRRGPAVPDSTIAELAAIGLSGVEVDHPEHDRAARSRLRFLAAELGLVATGGSDYHGTNKTIALGAESTERDAFEELLSRVPRPLPLPSAGGTGGRTGTTGTSG